MTMTTVLTRTLIRLFAAGAPLFAGTALFAAAPTHAAETVKAASAQNSVGSLPLILAQQRGFFTAEGINFEIVDFNGGGPAVQALAGGSVDVCICASDHAVRLASRGLGGSVLVALTEKHGYALLAKSDAPYKDWASLKGQKIGITSPGSLTDNTVRWAIKNAGMNPDTDIQIISAGLGGPMRAAVDTGALAAGMFTTPDTQALLSLGEKYKPVVDFRNLDYPALDLLVTKPWLNSHDAVAHGLARAVVKAEQLAASDPAVLRATIHTMFPNFSPELVETIAQELPRGSLSKDGRVNPKGFDNMMGMLRLADPSIKPETYQDIVAVQYLP
jgi:NitT/TauT family transport system substrate-binding protein